MRAPNILIFLLTMMLAFVGVWEKLGAPIKIPNFTLPLIGSSKDVIEPFLAAHSFGLVCAAWALLAIGVLLPRQARKRAGAAALARA
jgi:heme/copper-type cytochrome/quinol oxidase subunit 1